MMSEGEIQRRLDLLLRTGCLLMKSGADTIAFLGQPDNMQWI